MTSSASAAHSDRQRKAPQIGFCPFCRECFEDVKECPDHDLQLVAFDKLAPETPHHDEDAPVHPWNLRYGRAWLWVSGLLILIGFLMPLLTTVRPERMYGPTVTASHNGIQVALQVAPNLWILPMVTFGLFSLAMRRRTRKALRSARAVPPVLGAMAAASLGLTWVRISRGTELLTGQLGQDVAAQPSVGVGVVALGIGVAILSAWRVGRVPPRRVATRVQQASA